MIVIVVQFSTLTNDSCSPASEPQSQAEVIQTVLEKLGLSSTDIKAEEKVETLCVILNETLINNVQ